MIFSLFHRQEKMAIMIQTKPETPHKYTYTEKPVSFEEEILVYSARNFCTSSLAAFSIASWSFLACRIAATRFLSISLCCLILSSSSISRLSSSVGATSCALVSFLNSAHISFSFLPLRSMVRTLSESVGGGARLSSMALFPGTATALEPDLEK
ncbi:hypothetical protein VTO42DRAFT_7471 [Malbranchea cinnamomea]